MQKLNYSGNKVKINKLALDCIKHAETNTKKLLAMHSDAKGRLTKVARERAIKEEVALQDIYQYELNRAATPAMQKMLKELIKQEKGHEALVRSLK